SPAHGRHPLNLHNMNRDKIIEWVFRIVPAVIMLQTLFFKFTGHPASVALLQSLESSLSGGSAWV
ncbi:MAG: hypothetical protein AAFO91_17390, partial [Bacteroidota bacterium]